MVGFLFESLVSAKNDDVLKKLGCLVSYDGKYFETSSGFCYLFMSSLQKTKTKTRYFCADKKGRW